jgi:hypothetical protein
MSGFLDFITPGVGSAIGAGASLLGTFLGANQTNATNAGIAQQQAQYQLYGQAENGGRANSVMRLRAFRPIRPLFHATGRPNVSIMQ